MYRHNPKHTFILINPTLWLETIVHAVCAHICAYAALINEGPGTVSCFLLLVCVAVRGAHAVRKWASNWYIIITSCYSSTTPKYGTKCVPYQFITGQVFYSSCQIRGDPVFYGTVGNPTCRASQWWQSFVAWWSLPLLSDRVSHSSDLTTLMLMTTTAMLSKRRFLFSI